MKGAILFLVLCGCLAAQDASLAGVTVDVTNGRPLSGVHVRVFTLGSNGLPTTYGAVSDTAGHFSIAKIRPGSYFYLGERTGYLSLVKTGGGVPFPAVIVKSGEHNGDFKVEMTPRATVAGRVLDEYGDPVQNVAVQITPLSPDAPVAFSMTGGQAYTDDRGEFHLVAGPGKYHVKATPGFFGMNRQAEIRTDGSSTAAYAPTYFPSAAGPDRAVTVEVAAGAERNGIEIRLTRGRGGAASSIEGVVTGMPEGRQALVVLMSGESSARMTSAQSRSVSGNGRFSFGSVPPGYYRLEARVDGGTPVLRSNMVEFQDTAAPGPVELRLAPGAELTARVEMEGGKLPPGKRTVRMQAVVSGPMMGAAPSGELDAEGSARITDVFPGKYRVSVQPLPENAYIQTMQVDGAAASAGVLDLTHGGSNLKIVLRGDGGQISGSMLDADGSKVANTLGAVLLIRDLKKIEIDDEEHVARVMGDGTFTFKGVAPGKYWLIATDVFRSGNISGAESFQKLADAGEEVEVKPGERVVKNVHIAVKKEDANAKAKQ